MASKKKAKTPTKEDFHKYEKTLEESYWIGINDNMNGSFKDDKRWIENKQISKIVNELLKYQESSEFRKEGSKKVMLQMMIDNAKSGAYTTILYEGDRPLDNLIEFLNYLGLHDFSNRIEQGEFGDYFPPPSKSVNSKIKEKTLFI